jgi:hypothetical protein
VSAAEAASPEAVFWEAIAVNHLERYPLLEARDLYKLAHQAALGAEHAVGDPGAARDRLLDEIAALGLQPVAPHPADPAIDPISPDGTVLRVHLRPYLAANGSPQSLLQAFLRSTDSPYGSLARLQAYWAWSVKLAGKGFIPLDPAELEAFFEARRAEGFPAVHHSPAYQQAYRPAYRVVLAKFFEWR